MQQRLYYIDFLRVSAFMLLIAYHASVAFFPDMKWLIEAPEGSTTLSLIMKHPRAWRLALLFFVSGMGTWFVYRRCHDLSFLTGRFTRLFPPLIFAMCVIIVPQVWYERMYEEGYQGSFLTFWLTRYFTEGKYPDGNFTWAHMWFVAYLLVMTIVCYPVFRLIDQPFMKPVTDWFQRVAGSGSVYLLFLLPLVLNLVLSPVFPRQTNALYNDGAWFAVWASWFGLGFLFARYHQALIGNVVGLRWQSAGLAAALTAALYLFSWTGTGGAFIGDYETMTPLFKTLLMALAWTMILALCGFTAKHLNAPSVTVSWLNRKVFPLYIVHQTVVLAALYYVLPLGLGVWTEYALVLTATFAGSFLFAIAVEWLPGRSGILAGLAPRGRPLPAGGAETQSVRGA
ncbi:Acyltransferase family protein [Nitratireductor aquibiodomus]|uniref:Acyltransferase family protein n=1 Tax=Nitratireductor aquibiodomus TaxID=204799 RepID=A0A1H4LHV3_9HYPH|nr:acyltransferase [Nitratireductor aquibiodomus]SEB70299.1 Acyltransferase family protein [Nitratireductor aquibiodomus]